MNAMIKLASDPKTPAEPHERISGSGRNEPGSAKGSKGGIKLDLSTDKSLRGKAEEHNNATEDKDKKVDIGALKAVYRRGAGAFSSSHRPGMNRNQWSMGRVNAFLHLLRTGSPKNPKYVNDNDLLPASHPRSTK